LTHIIEWPMSFLIVIGLTWHDMTTPHVDADTQQHGMGMGPLLLLIDTSSTLLDCSIERLVQTERQTGQNWFQLVSRKTSWNWLVNYNWTEFNQLPMVWSGCLKIGLWLQLCLMRVQKPDWTKLLNTKSTSFNEGRGRKKAWGDQVWAWVIVVGGKRAVMAVDIPAITLITTVGVLNSQVTHSKIYVWHRFPGVSLLSPCVMTLTCVCVSCLVHPCSPVLHICTWIEPSSIVMGKGLGTLQGSWVGVRRVTVRVKISGPSTNPYPHEGSRVSHYNFSPCY